MAFGSALSRRLHTPGIKAHRNLRYAVVYCDWMIPECLTIYDSRFTSSSDLPVINAFERSSSVSQ
jgi:hypothetical protein